MKPMQIFKTSLLAILLATTACGGDGGEPSGGNNPPAADRTPEAFGFEAVENAEPGEFYEATVTITGLGENEEVPLVLGEIASEYRLLINGEAPQNPGNRGSVKNDDVVTVGLRAASEPEGHVFATLTVGEPSVSADYAVTTKADINAPSLAVHFPPPMSMTDIPLPDGIVTLRGAVTDDKPGVQVFVNDIETPVDPETGEWMFNYQIQAGENLIDIQAMDGSENLAVPVVLNLLHVSDRMAGVTFGTGDAFSGVESVHWDAVQQRLLFGANGIFQLDMHSATSIRVTPEISGYGLLHDVAHDRYIASRFSSGSDHQHGIFTIDPASGVATPLSIRSDGGGTTNFHLINDLAVSADGRRLFAHIWAPEADAEALLWVVDSDPESPAFGARAIFSDEGFRRESGLAMDETRGRLLIGDCSLKALPLDASAGTFTETVIAATEEFCIQELLVVEDAAWARDVRDAADRLLRIDLLTETYSVVSDLTNPLAGPVTLTTRGMKISEDAERGLLYFPLHGDGLEQPDAIAVIDARTGQRVIVAQRP